MTSFDLGPLDRAMNLVRMLADGTLSKLTQAEQEALAVELEAVGKMWIPQPRQRVAVEMFQQVDELLFGGSAGGGKSYALLQVAIIIAETYPGVRILVLRRVFPSLERTVLATLRSLLSGTSRAEWNANKHTWNFPNGSVIECSSLQYNHSVYDFSGAEYGLIIFEEVSEFLQEQYEFMLSRLRSTVPGVVPRVLCSANPIGPGARWVRGRWVMPSPGDVPDNVLCRIAKSEKEFEPFGEWKSKLGPTDKIEVMPDQMWRPKASKDNLHPTMRAFVPAQVTDNVALLRADPGYLSRLEGIRDPRARRALRAGDWTAMDDVEGALWDMLTVELTRLINPPPFAELVIGIDPSGSASGDEVGIVAAGRGFEFPQEHYYVIEDVSGHYGPNEWVNIAIGLYDRIGADRIIVETNYGGDMALTLINNVRPLIPVDKVVASRAKRVRAEPVSQLWYLSQDEGGPRGHVVGKLEELEEEMTSWTPGSTESPGRFDALVWAITYLSTGAVGGVDITGFELTTRRLPGHLAGGQ